MSALSEPPPVTESGLDLRFTHVFDIRIYFDKRFYVHNQPLVCILARALPNQDISIQAFRIGFTPIGA